jgi:imidazolonepropionase
MQHATLIVHSADQLITMPGGPQRGRDLGRLGLIKDGAVAIIDGQISAVGPTREIRARYRAERELDASGRVALPGFVDPHTHVVWSGDRAAEFEMRVSGASYMEIMEAGGGILSTVRETRDATTDELVQSSLPRLTRMLAHGTTTAEAKTGYGLETGTELRMLEAILEMNHRGPMELAPTFMGAHAVPAEYAGRGDEYVGLVCREMLPAVRDWWQVKAQGCPLPFVDVFCEPGAFDLEDSRRILDQAQVLGFPLKMHVDEFESLGGTDLAISRGAVSADHLVRTPPEEIERLGRSKTVAVSLPCTPFGLAQPHYSPAKSILQAGGILAVASDLNPGTAWCESMQFVIALACRYLGLTPAQAIAAATINAAAAIARQERIGSLEVGKQGDLILLDVPDYRHLGYRFGTNLVSMVIKRGKIVSTNGEGRWTS